MLNLVSDLFYETRCRMFGVCDVAEAVATRKDTFVKRYVLSSNVVCEISSIFS